MVHEYIHGILDDMLGFQYLIKLMSMGFGNFGGYWERSHELLSI